MCGFLGHSAHLGCSKCKNRKLSLVNIKLADALLLQFCKRSEHVYGADIITRNMHLHCHLKDCILDYGPLHGFWLFAFERYNGLLGQLPNNNHSIEVQLMKRVINDNTVLSTSLPKEFNEDFAPLFVDENKSVGSLLETTEPLMPLSFDFSQWGVNPCSEITLKSHISRGVFKRCEMDYQNYLASYTQYRNYH